MRPKGNSSWEVGVIPREVSKCVARQNNQAMSREHTAKCAVSRLVSQKL